jgi:hypothetical protein
VKGIKDNTPTEEIRREQGGSPIAVVMKIVKQFFETFLSGRLTIAAKKEADRRQ